MNENITPIEDISKVTEDIKWNCRKFTSSLVSYKPSPTINCKENNQVH